MTTVKLVNSVVKRPQPEFILLELNFPQKKFIKSMYAPSGELAVAQAIGTALLSLHRPMSMYNSLYLRFRNYSLKL